MDLVIATRNSSKLRELRAVFEELLPDVVIGSLVDIRSSHPETTERHEPLGVEDDETAVYNDHTYQSGFEATAAAKAMEAARVFGVPAIADESGLVIPLFGGWQESYRRKQLQPAGKRLPNTRQILEDLQNADEADRGAFLECAIAFAVPLGAVKVVSARMEGVIAQRERGPASFDFSSIFIKHEYSKTLAELPESVFARISHRRKACEKMGPSLREYFSKKSPSTSRSPVRRAS